MKPSIAFLLIALLFVACGDRADSQAACSERDIQAAGELIMDGAVMAFMDADAVAEATGRSNLSPLVREMQQIQDDLADEDWPSCAGDIKGDYRAWMTATIDSYLAFMANESDTTIQNHIRDANAALSAATDAWIEMGAE